MCQVHKSLSVLRRMGDEQSLTKIFGENCVALRKSPNNRRRSRGESTSRNTNTKRATLVLSCYGMTVRRTQPTNTHTHLTVRLFASLRNRSARTHRRKRYMSRKNEHTHTLHIVRLVRTYTPREKKTNQGTKITTVNYSKTEKEGHTTRRNQNITTEGFADEEN